MSSCRLSHSQTYYVLYLICGITIITKWIESLSSTNYDQQQHIAEFLLLHHGSQHQHHKTGSTTTRNHTADTKPIISINVNLDSDNTKDTLKRINGVNTTTIDPLSSRQSMPMIMPTTNATTILEPLSHPSFFLQHTNFSFRLKNRDNTMITINALPNTTRVYVVGRADRPGAAIWDYLQGHAFAYQHSINFGGPCGHMTWEPAMSRQRDQFDLLQELGLSPSIIPSVVPKCPPSLASLPQSHATVGHGTDKNQSESLSNHISYGSSMPTSGGSSLSSSSPPLWFVLPSNAYFEWDGAKQGLTALTSEWIRHLSKSLHPDFHRYQLRQERTVNDSNDTSYRIRRSEDLPPLSTSSTTTTTIVVHIRRGDVHPCDVYTQNRYLTNEYYIHHIRDAILRGTTNNDNDNDNNEVTNERIAMDNTSSKYPQQQRLRQHNMNHFKVIVHSQLNSFESWDDFRFDMMSMIEEVTSSATRNGTNVTVDYELKLNSPTRQVWIDIVKHADVFIMSKSAFSQTAAVLMMASASTSTSMIPIDGGTSTNNTNDSTNDTYNVSIVCWAFSYCHPSWHAVNQTIRNDEEQRLNDLVGDKCTNQTYDSRAMPWSERLKLG